MESPSRSRRQTLSLAFRSVNVRDISKQSQKAASKVRKNLDPEAPAEKHLDAPKPSRRPSFRQAVRDGLERIRQPKQPLPKQPLAKSPSKQPSLGATPRQIMNLFQQQAAGNNGGPVRQPQPVIDLTSDDEDDEDEFYEDAPKPQMKRERLDMGHHNGQEPVGRMKDRVPALGLAEQPRNPPIVPEYAFARPQDIWGDYDLDENFDDEIIAGAFDFNQEFAIHPAPTRHPKPATPDPPAVPPIQEDMPEEIMETKIDCVDTILTVFPGICRDYVSELYDTVSQSSERLIAHILDKMDKGSPYPNAKEKLKKLKRKREVDEDMEAARKYGATDRIMPTTVGGIRSFIAKILSFEFPFTSMNYINATLSQTGYRLFSAYEVLDEAERTWSRSKPPYQRLKSARKSDDYTEKKVADYLASPAVDGYNDHQKVEVFEELQAARRIRSKANARRAAERAAEIKEEENLAKAEAEGTMSECECCCCDYPLNRMVHCDGEKLHWFCRGCAKRTAEVEIGKSKYELHCMSTEKCSAGFSLEQRAQFLDENTRVALERNEQEANLRLAGIENLESCPFCPFAAEYPLVEIDREFRCQAPDCERISCRLCKLESHIPKSCEENAKENGLSIRRQIEEAMSAAMIRKCNKCGTPFVKEEGCNKMTCTRNGCRNIQCYVCSKSCDYNHFNDPSRGGKVGNCPLFESVEQRHDEEVKRAEKEALEKVLADHPEYSEEDLKVKMSENVKKDDEKRKNMDPRMRLEAMRVAVGRPGLRVAVNFMEIRPMMPHPPAMRRRAHDLPDYPHLGHDLPDYVDPMDPPIYGDWAVDFADQNEMPDYQGNVGNWQRAPLHARGIDGPGVIIQDPRIRPQRPRHHHPRALRPDYNQLDNDMQRPAPQAIAAPRIDGPAVLDIVNPLENFYEQWRAEVQHRQGNGQPAPAQPRIPVVAPVPKGDAIADQNRGRVGRARANFHFLGNRRAHQPPDPVAQPVFRPNAVPVPEPANAHGNAQQRMRIVFHRPARPQNAEDLREPGAADALQRRINRLRESLAAREGRNAHNADVDFQARLVFEERRRRQVAGAAFGADVMEGVAQDVPAPENNAHDGASRQDIIRQRLQDPNDAVRQQRGLQEQGRPPGNHIERNLDRDMLEEDRSPTPSSTPSKADAPAPPQPGGGLQEFLRELDVPARPQPVHEIERLLRELNRQRNDQRLAEQELANVQRGLDRAEAFANAVPLPPPGPNHYPRPNPWVGIYDYHGPEQLRMHQQLEQIAIANAPLNHNPNQILGHNPYLNQQPGHVVDYNRPPLRPLDHFNMPDPQIAPIHQQVHIDINNMPPVAPPVVRPNVGEILANAQAINQMHAQIVAQEQMVQAQAQAAAEAQARAEAQIQAVVQGQAMAQAGGIPVIPPPFPRHDMHDYVRQYAQEYHAGREANRVVDRAGAALGANIWEPVHPPVNPLLGEIPMDHLGRFDDAMRHVRQMRERLEGRIAQPVHVPEEIEEEYESDIGAADV